LTDILIPYETRSTLIQYLSAYDTAKLNLSLNYILDDSEQQRYINPIRDLIWDVSDMRDLEQEGMKLILFGNDVLALEQRLRNTRQYLKVHKHTQRLQIYLIGIFPIREKTDESLSRMVRFSLGGKPNNHRIIKDQLQLQMLKQKVDEDDWDSNENFLMAFGAPTNLFVEEEKGFWYEIPEVPDSTVNLKVYVPTFFDRKCGDIHIPFLDIPKISG
ncbi:hypothetical protein K469DRAFT_476679, partial [Zopfia rhizophila CBS 207.26]